MLTKEQLQQRRNHIGGSDAAAVLGIDPWKNAHDLYLDKTGQVEDWTGNDATRRGDYLEPAILDWFRGRTNLSGERGKFVISANGISSATYDEVALADDPQQWVVNAKTSAHADEWGEDGSDVVPENYLVQSHHEMLVAGPRCTTAYIPALIAGFKSLEFRLFVIPRNDELIKIIEQAELDFWNLHVLRKMPPVNFRPNLDVLRRVKRTPSKIVELPADTVARYLQAKDAAKSAAELVDQATAELLSTLGDAEGGICPAGTFTYMEESRKGYTVEATTFRALRFKKTKVADAPKAAKRVASTVR